MLAALRAGLALLTRLALLAGLTLLARLPLLSLLVATLTRLKLLQVALTTAVARVR